MHLLVVDDNADVRAYLDDLLCGYGHNVTLAANGQAALPQPASTSQTLSCST